MRSNHNCLSIILPPSPPPSNLSLPIMPQSCFSPPFHYSHLTGQKIRVTFGGPLASSTFHSLHILSFYFSPITPSSLVGIWRVTLGQFNLLSPSAFQGVAASCPQAYPSTGLSACFLHFTPPLPSFTTQNFLFPHLSLLFSIHFFFKLTSDI